MNTKYLIKSLICVMFASNMFANSEPEQEFSVNSTNENGEPIENVEVKAWFKLPEENVGIKDYSEIGFTDIEGRIDLTGRTIWTPTSIEARKDGYYLSMAGDHWTISRLPSSLSWVCALITHTVYGLLSWLLYVALIRRDDRLRRRLRLI